MKVSQSSSYLPVQSQSNFHSPFVLLLPADLLFPRNPGVLSGRSVTPNLKPSLSSKVLLQSMGQQSLGKTVTLKKHLDIDTSSSGFIKPSIAVAAAKTTSHLKGSHSTHTFDTQDLKSARSVCVLSLDELQSMKERSKQADSLLLSERNSEKRHLHELSMKRVEKWPDSLLTITQKKQKERYERFEKIEHEKRLIDEQEEAIRQLKKRMAIKEANQKIFDADPRVRQFKQKVLFLEVNEERKEQAEIVKEKQEMYRLFEAERQVQAEHTKQLDEEAERMKKVRKTIELKQLKEALQDQIQKAKTQRFEEYKNYNTEGQMLKEKAAEEEAENIEKKANKKAKAKRYLDDVEDQQRSLNEMKKEAERKEQEADAREQLVAQKKAQLLEMRRQREGLKIKQLIDIRDKMYNSQLEEMKSKTNNEEARIQMQVEQQRQKEDKIAQEKEQDLKKRRQLMKQSIQESLEFKQKLEVERKQKEKDLAESMLKQSRIIEQIDQEEKVFQLKRKYDIRNQQQAQIDEKKKIIENKLVNELNEDESLRNSIQVDRRVFSGWADQQIEELRQSGRPVEPLIRELMAIQKAN